MLETKQPPKGRFVVLLMLATVFFFPTLLRMLDLVEAGGLRAVDMATIFAGGFTCGILTLKALLAWRAHGTDAAA